MSFFILSEEFIYDYDKLQKCHSDSELFKKTESI